MRTVRDMLDMVPVTSSNLAAVGYDSRKSELWVRFLDDSLYRYDGVPAIVHAELMAAASHGGYLHQHVKGRYPYRRVQ